MFTNTGGEARETGALAENDDAAGDNADAERNENFAYTGGKQTRPAPLQETVIPPNAMPPPTRRRQKQTPITPLSKLNELGK